MSHNTSLFIPHLSHQADKLKGLLLRDDQRRRQEFIRNLSERHLDKIPYRDNSTLSSSPGGGRTVEDRLRLHMDFYQNGLAHMQRRSDDFTEASQKLQCKMKASVDGVDGNGHVTNDQGEVELNSTRQKERLLRTKGECESTTSCQNQEGQLDEQLELQQRHQEQQRHQHQQPERHEQHQHQQPERHEQHQHQQPERHEQHQHQQQLQQLKEQQQEQQPQQQQQHQPHQQQQQQKDHQLQLEQHLQQQQQEQRQQKRQQHQKLQQEDEHHQEKKHTKHQQHMLREEQEHPDQPKSEIDTEDFPPSIGEPGQVTTETDYRLFPPPTGNRRMSNMSDYGDLSLGSEPGQITGITDNFVSRNKWEPCDETEELVNDDVSDNEQRSNQNDNGPASDVKKYLRIAFDENNNVIGEEGQQDVRSPRMSNGVEGSLSYKDVGDARSLDKEIRGMKELYETKTKHLQLLLHAGKKQIEAQQLELTKLREELRMFRIPVRDGSMGEEGGGGMRPVCEKKLVQELLMEREELFEAIKRQQAMVAEGNRLETEAYYQVKKSCELVEQVELEKQEAFVHVKQLQEDILQSKERYLLLQKNHQDQMQTLTLRLKQESENAVADLGKTVTEQEVSIAVLEKDLEKCAREKAEMKSELDKTVDHSQAQLSKSNDLFEQAQREVMEALKRQTLAEHEAGQLRLESKIKEKRIQQEVDQVSLEVCELKRRLAVTEDNLSISQNNELELTQQLNECRQQLQQHIQQHTNMVNTFEQNRKRMENEALHHQEEVCRMLAERDKYHEVATEELTRMLDTQTQIMAGYQTECKELTEKLQTEQKQRHNDVEKLTQRCRELEEACAKLEERDSQNEEVLHTYQQNMKGLENELNEKKEMVMVLVSKQAAILRDRYLLGKEVQLLKTQLAAAQ